MFFPINLKQNSTKNFFHQGKIRRSKKLKFTKEEDEKLKQLVAEYGENEWSLIAKKMGNRNSRQCRERWKNYMNPCLSKENWSTNEDMILMQRFCEVGPHWNIIAQSFPHRSINCVRNRLIKLNRKGQLTQFNFQYGIRMNQTFRQNPNIITNGYSQMNYNLNQYNNIVQYYPQMNHINDFTQINNSEHSITPPPQMNSNDQTYYCQINLTSCQASMNNQNNNTFMKMKNQANNSYNDSNSFIQNQFQMISQNAKPIEIKYNEEGSDSEYEQDSNFKADDNSLGVVSQSKEIVDIFSNPLDEIDCMIQFS